MSLHKKGSDILEDVLACPLSKLHNLISVARGENSTSGGRRVLQVEGAAGAKTLCKKEQTHPYHGELDVSVEPLAGWP